MKKEVTLNEEDFLQQFPNQALFDREPEDIPDSSELDQSALQNLKPFNFADLHQAAQPAPTQTAAAQTSTAVPEQVPIDNKEQT